MATTTWSPASARLTLRGELDLLAVAHLDRAATTALELRDELVLDLAAVTFIDSSGMRWLLRLQRRISDRRGRLTIVAASPGLLRAFDLAGVGRLLPLRPEEPGADAGPG